LGIVIVPPYNEVSVMVVMRDNVMRDNVMRDNVMRDNVMRDA
jgi:hypothetical protein